MQGLRLSRSSLPVMCRRVLQIAFMILICAVCMVQTQNVGLAKTGFENLPSTIFYFEDSGVILYFDSLKGNVYRSPDEGKSWAAVSGVPPNSAISLIQHPFSKDSAYILVAGTTHYKTEDKGETWHSFDVPLPPASESQVLAFHAERPRYVLYSGTKCDHNSGWSGKLCHDETFYTKDAFDTPPKLLLSYTSKCIWSRSTTNFQNTPVQTIFCTEFASKDNTGVFDRVKDIRLVQSDDFFESKTVVALERGAEVRGVVGIGAVEKFLVAAVKVLESEEMIMYVTNDGKQWAKAQFPSSAGPIHEHAYTVLESSAHSLVVDVWATRGSYGTLFFSNSNGTFYTRSLEHTNRNNDGIVDFEKIHGVDGILIANVVENWNMLSDQWRESSKKLRTKMSFDDGGSWRYIKNVVNIQGMKFDCLNQHHEDEGECALHLHGVTVPHNFGQVFASASAPGVVMGVGNVGPNLKPYDECDTFLSFDGGLTWRMIMEGARKYEFGDMGGILVIADDENPTDHIHYSFDRGATWTKFDLGISVRVRMLTTDPDSTSQKFILIGSYIRGDQKGDSHPIYLFQIDFETLNKRKCVLDENNPERSDFEKWYARNMEDGPDCLMGHTTAYWRRKANADCFVNEKFSDPKIIVKDCACDDEDFECDINFVRDNTGKCVQIGPDVVPESACRNAGDSYKGSSGYRLVPGNTCDREKGKKLDEPVDKLCKADQVTAPPLGDVNHKSTIFSHGIDYFYYFAKSPVILLKTVNNQVWRSENEGEDWTQVLQDAGPIGVMIMHEHDNNRAYFFTETELYSTTDQAKTFNKIKIPLGPNKLDLPLLDFHPEHSDWLLFVGATPCPGCHTEAYFSSDHGSNWQQIDTWVEKCIFGRDVAFKETPESTIFCSSYRNKDSHDGQDILLGHSTEANPLQFYRTDDYGKNKEILFDNVAEFYVFEKFMTIAIEKGETLSLKVSVDGNSFADAQFPPQTRVDKNAFTILQSTTGSIFLDVMRTTTQNREFGSLFKSNSNGTFYTVTLPNTNRNSKGLVDFEKIQGVNGIVLVNQVINAEEVNIGGTKKVRSMISFDDGGQWEPLRPPKEDALGRPIECQQKCQLNLHGRTDIRGPGAVYSAEGAPGLMMGIGNVGESLLSYEDGNTYLTRDGGRTWTEIRRGESLYEFGDQGSILVVVDDEGPTDSLMYSWNMGKDWSKYTFADTPVRVSILTTEPKSSTLKFLILGHTIPTSTHESQQVVISVDFSGLQKRKCVLDPKDDSINDFERWSPRDADDSKCLLGKEIIYWRRKSERQCYIGDNFGDPDTISEGCSCSKQDFECDFGYWRNENGECVLFGYDPDRPANCPPGTKYMASSGYRKITMSSCQGGVDLEKKVEKVCSETDGVQIRTMEWDTLMAENFYFENTSIVLMRTVDNQVYRTENEGYSWTRVLPEHKIIRILHDSHFNDRAFFITEGTTHFVTNDHAITFGKIDVPMKPNFFDIPIISTHPEERDWLIYVGQNGCDSFLSEKCFADAYYTQNGGGRWDPLGQYVRNCQWARDAKFKKADTKLIFCEFYTEKAGSQSRFFGKELELYASSDFFKTSRVVFKNIVGFATFEEFMVVAQLGESLQNLRLQVSLDGDTFAEAHFPSGVHVNDAFTVLESLTHSIWLHLTSNVKRGSEWGTIFTSNSNGTYYRLSLDYVNRDEKGYVDFEKMQGIGGIALANQVVNPNQANIGDPKKLKTLITFDNGSRWKRIKAPEKDMDGKSYNCGENCFLNLHSYTERRNPQDMFSSSPAVGLMIGVGNVGDTLLPYLDSDTFITRDAGVTWTEVKKDAHMWEFGDQGAILVLVNDEEPTDHVLYSINEGQTFHELAFTKPTEKVRVTDIATIPGGTSRRFIVYGTKGSHPTKQVAIQLDFTGIHRNQCKLDLDHPNDDDFELWNPGDVNGEHCLFGREVKYHRRILGRDCYIGEKMVQPRAIIRNCTCTDADFECDYNYIRDSNDKCVLTPGAQPLQPTCTADQLYYYEMTGYRKIPISSCEGGVEKDKGNKIYCPGKASSSGIWAFILLLPLGVAGVTAIVWWYRKGGQVGRIRLPDSVYDTPSIFGRIALAAYGLVVTLLEKLQLPSFISQLFDRVRYTPLSQEEPAEVLMDDYLPNGHSYDDEDEVDEEIERQ
ncbi:uncharacterized protein VTP21DRAFT_5903 [Calcarisporiella thermophila]|uniref:uncharacterized protein n=1 Tax=Calcarisporiella thermophila TaxID=911321 RepID=UPI00374323BE